MMGNEDPDHHFDFVMNIANYHLGHLDQAIDDAVRIANQVSARTPRFLLQAGFLYWCRYEKDKDTNRADLSRALEFADKAVRLSRKDRASRVLALANLGRGYAEAAALAEKSGAKPDDLWRKATQAIEGSALLCNKLFKEVDEWPACVVYARVHIWYEFLKKKYQPYEVTSTQAQEALTLIQQKIGIHISALKNNARWQRREGCPTVQKLTGRVFRFNSRLEKRLEPEKPV